MLSTQKDPEWGAHLRQRLIDGRLDWIFGGFRIIRNSKDLESDDGSIVVFWQRQDGMGDIRMECNPETRMCCEPVLNTTNDQVSLYVVLVTLEGISQAEEESSNQIHFRSVTMRFEVPFWSIEVNFIRLGSNFARKETLGPRGLNPIQELFLHREFVRG